MNNCDRDYGIMCLKMYPNMHYFIDSVEYQFDLWNNLDKDFGVQEVEDEACNEPNISSCALSRDSLASKFSNKVNYDE